MKLLRLIHLAITMLVCMMANAEEVSEQQALLKAQQFMQGKQFVTFTDKARHKGLQVKDTIKLGYYVFNTTDQDGFVVVASDDRMPDILGFSPHGRLNPETAPNNVRWLLDYYNKVAASLGTAEVKTRVVSRASKPDIRPLITTTWAQGSPYNDLCPTYGGERCVTGCVATAMAQVINYNRWPQGQTKAVEPYTSGNLGIKMPKLEPTQFNWDNMTNEDVARLMLYCGQSVQMDYGTRESGAMGNYEAPALINVFGYSQTTHFVAHSSYSDEDWEDLLYNELAEQRPIIYHGNGTGGGHAFIIHGYSDGCFYINWGWSGDEDGYFKLTGLETGIGDFNSGQDATIGIQPPAGNIIGRPKVVVKSIEPDKGKYTLRGTDGGFGSVNISSMLAADLSEPVTLYVGLGLYDDSGMLKVLSEEKHTFPVGEEYQYNATVTIGSDFPQGTYRIVPISRDSKDVEWMTDANASDYYLEIKVDERWMRLRSFPLSAEENDKEEMDIVTANGFAYCVYKQNGRNRATLLYCEDGKPRGNVNIPDDVTFDGNRYKVYDVEEGLFGDCPDLTSLSIASTNAPYIYNCPKLSQIELREGVVTMKHGIQSCPAVETMVFPKSLSTVEHSIEWCENLKSIRFNNPYSFTFNFYPQWQEESLPALRDVYFSTADAPLFRFEVGEFIVNANTTIHVPEGAKTDYENARWKGWKIVEDQPLTDSETITWGYCEGDKVSDVWTYDESGNNDSEYAIHAPAEVMAAYVGKQISSIQFFQTDKLCDYVFITKPGTDYLVKQTAGGEAETWVDIQLTQPYVITGDELYVGIGRRGTVSAYFSDLDAKTEDSFWYRVMGEDNSRDMVPGKWFRPADQNETYNHPIALRFIISGEELPNDIAINDVTLKPAAVKGKYTVQMKAVNRSKVTVRKLTVNWNVDGNSQGSKQMETAIRPKHQQDISFDIELTIEGRRHQFNYNITEVDGQADAVAVNSTGSVAFNATPNTVYPRRIVMEEATGTWAGSSVRGIETINRLAKEYPDHFIPIALHKSDEMSKIENYNAIIRRFNACPNSLINRTTEMDPAYPKVRSIIEELKDNAEAKIEATALFALRDGSAVTVTTTTRFGFSDKSTSNFRLAYVVVEDHVGPYEQKNGYSGNVLADDENYMGEWTKKESMVLMEHHAVARGIYGGIGGIQGSIPDEVKEGVDYQYSNTFYLPETIQDKKNVRVIALLIDSISGAIVNAAQTTVANNPELDKQTFELRHAGKAVFDNDAIVCYAAKQEEMFACATDGLALSAIDGKEKEGTVTLEILSNSIASASLDWTIGGQTESVLGQLSMTKDFKTNADGTLPVSLYADGLGNPGTLEVLLTTTVGTEIHRVTIRFIYEKQIVNDVKLKSGEAWWFNYDNNDEIQQMGGSVTERYHVATYIPLGMIKGGGITIDGFSFWRTTIAAENVTVWVSKTLPDSDEEADLERISIPNSQLSTIEYDVEGRHVVTDGRFYQVAFLNQHIIPEEGLYVGYSFDITNSEDENWWCPVSSKKGENSREGSFLIKTTSRRKWDDVSSTRGNLMAQVLIGSSSQSSSLSITSVRTAYGISGGKARTILELQNDALSEAKNFHIKVEGQKGEPFETKVSATIPALSRGNKVAIELKADQDVGMDEKTITITKVNSKSITSEKASAKFKLYTLKKKSFSVPVVEYVTELPGNCTFNQIGFKKLSDKYGERMILVNAHQYGVLYIPDYSDIFGLMRGWSGVCHINRNVAIKLPYFGSMVEPLGIIKDVQGEMQTAAPGAISVRTAWTDNDKTRIDITTETQFEIDSDDSPFQIGYVLLEDGMSGTGEEWYFQNDIHDQYLTDKERSDPDYKEWIDRPEMVTDMKYDNVAVAAWKPFKGVSGSLPTQIKAGESYAYSYQADIAGNRLIQNKDNLSIVALLLDKDFGTIINAARCTIGGESPDLGISNLAISREGDNHWYNLDGTRLDAAPTRKGIYIRNGKKIVK